MAGSAGDVIDLIPFVTGLGEVTRAVKTVVVKWSEDIKHGRYYRNHGYARLAYAR